MKAVCVIESRRCSHSPAPADDTGAAKAIRARLLFITHAHAPHLSLSTGITGITFHSLTHVQRPTHR